MSDMKIPGVNIVEKKAFPNSVVEVATAIPAFVGFTEKAEKGTQSLLNVPYRISSMVEYEKYFGGAPKNVEFDLIDGESMIESIYEIIPNKCPEGYEMAGFPVSKYGQLTGLRDEYLKQYENLQTNLVLGNHKYCLRNTKPLFTMYQHVKLYFANGGGSCYIISVGNYGGELKQKAFEDGIELLKKEQEPTLLVVPEAVNLDEDSCYTVNRKMLSHCGEMKNRFAILDIHDRYRASISSLAKKFGEKVGNEFLNYGSTYYPWLNTSSLDIQKVSDFISKDSILYLLISNKNWDRPDERLHKLYCFLLNSIYEYIEKTDKTDKDELKKMVCFCICSFDELFMKEVNILDGQPMYTPVIGAAKNGMPKLNEEEKNSLVAEWWKSRADEDIIQKSLRRIVNRLPASAAMAGVYARVDSTRGVWKAPANVSLNMVISPTVDITDDEQKDLNAPVDSDSKPINAIRHFVGSSIQVWGARTLDNKNLDWRYINVRRTMIFLEESIKNATRSYVFEPNDANTWLNMKCMIENFLRDVWKRGGLAGASPEDAFQVHIGLGETMTPKDVVEGIMRISVLVAITHPAEFIEISFQQQVQKS